MSNLPVDGHEWQDHPTHEVPTSFGNLKVVISGGSSAYNDDRQPMHAYVRTDPYEVNAPDPQVIRINGVDYVSVSIWLEQLPTGLWDLTGDGMQSRYHSISGHRDGIRPTNAGYTWGNLTSAARKVLREKLVPELETWLLTHPELVDEARRITARQNAHRVAQDLIEAEKDFRTLRARLDRLDEIVQAVPA